MYLKLYDMYLLGRSEPVLSIIRSTINYQNYPESTPSKIPDQQNQNIKSFSFIFLTNSSPTKKTTAPGEGLQCSITKTGTSELDGYFGLGNLRPLDDSMIFQERDADNLGEVEVMDEWCVVLLYGCINCDGWWWLWSKSEWSLWKRIDLIYKLMQLGFADNKQVHNCVFTEHWPWRMPLQVRLHLCKLQ